MQLTHLGAPYTPSTQSIETIETATQLSFLGRTFNMRAPISIPARPTSNNLIYRGVRYRA